VGGSGVTFVTGSGSDIVVVTGANVEIRGFEIIPVSSARTPSGASTIITRVKQRTRVRPERPSLHHSIAMPPEEEYIPRPKASIIR